MVFARIVILEVMLRYCASVWDVCFGYLAVLRAFAALRVLLCLMRPISVLAISAFCAPDQRFGDPDAPSCGGYTEIGRSG